jgi:exopolysaccharide production protein ExoQ
VLYTAQDYQTNPALVYAQFDDGGAGPWITRLGTLLLALVTVPELMRWCLGERSMAHTARRLWLAAGLYVLGTLGLAGLAGETHGWRLNQLYMPMMFTGLALLGHVDPKPALRSLRWCLAAVMLGSLLAGWWAPTLALDRDYASLIPGLNWRLVGLTDHANSLGALAVVALMLELSPAVQARPRLLLLIPALAVLLLSQSKTAWIEVVLALSLLRFNGLRARLFGRERARGVAGMLALLAIAVALLLILLGVLASSERALAWIDQASLTTLTGRTKIWEITWAEFERSPWLGYGPALWDAQYRYEQGLVSVGQGHNQYIHTLGQAGLVGAGCLLVYLLTLLRNCLTAWRAGVGLPLALLLLLLVRGVTETPLNLNSILSTDAFLHLLAFGLAANSHHFATRAHAPAAPRPPPESAIDLV